MVCRYQDEIDNVAAPGGTPGFRDTVATGGTARHRWSAARPARGDAGPQLVGTGGETRGSKTHPAAIASESRGGRKRAEQRHDAHGGDDGGDEHFEQRESGPLILHDRKV